MTREEHLLTIAMEECAELQKGECASGVLIRQVCPQLPAKKLIPAGLRVLQLAYTSSVQAPPSSGSQAGGHVRPRGRPAVGAARLPSPNVIAIPQLALAQRLSKTLRFGLQEVRLGQSLNELRAHD